MRDCSCSRLYLLIYFISFFLPWNFNKFAESKCYFLGNLVVLLVKLPLTTSAKVPGSTPGYG